MRVVNEKSVGADADVASDPASRASPLLQSQSGRLSLWEPGLPAMLTTGCCVRPRTAGKPAPADSTRSTLPVGVWLASDADYGVLRLTPHRGQARSYRLNPVNSPCGSLACQRCRPPCAASDPASRASPLLQIQPGQFSLWEPGLPAMPITGCCVRSRIAGKPAPTDSTRSILPVGVWLASDADHGVLRPPPHRGQACSCRLNPVNSPCGSLACQRCRPRGEINAP